MDTNTDEAGFAAFWAAYPIKVAKGAARRSWPRAMRAVGGNWDVVIAGAERYRDDPNRLPAFTKHPSTWLNGECWSDPVLPARERGRRPDGTGAVIDELLEEMGR